MSQTNTNTNNGPSNMNQNQLSGRMGQSRGGPSSRDCSSYSNSCGNKSIANKYSFEAKMRDDPISKLTITKTGIKPFNTRW